MVASAFILTLEIDMRAKGGNANGSTTFQKPVTDNQAPTTHEPVEVTSYSTCNTQGTLTLAHRYTGGGKAKETHTKGKLGEPEFGSSRKLLLPLGSAGAPAETRATGEAAAG
jgi:hypothetical protein